jgi:hypothetical protein
MGHNGPKVTVVYRVMRIWAVVCGAPELEPHLAGSVAEKDGVKPNR